MPAKGCCCSAAAKGGGGAAGSGQGASATGVALTQAALSGQIEICYIKLFKCIYIVYSIG